MSNIAGTTVTYIGGGSRKFYRVFTVEETEIRQWGRVGTSGQFQLIDHGGKRAAEESAENQLRTKEAKGYNGRISRTFGFDPDTFNRIRREHGDKAAGQAVATALEAAETGEQFQPSGETWDHREPETETDKLEEFAQRALRTVSRAAQGDQQAAVEYAMLRQDFEAIEEQYNRAESFLGTIETMLAQS